MKILFTSSGRRVELIKLFIKEGFITYSVDSDPTAPSLYITKKSFIVPKVTEKPNEYIDILLNLCRKEKIDIIIPLIDPELIVFAKEKNRFKDIGTDILISSYESIIIASNKYLTFKFFEKIGLPTPLTLNIKGKEFNINDINKENVFPALLKPIYGSASKGILECENIEYLKFYATVMDLKNYIIQKKVYGEEITIDVFGDGTGKLISAVQRKRIKVRSGEVERGITVKYFDLFNDIEKLTKKFKPYGPINIQCIYDTKNNKKFFTEINARFGGGYPLSYYAGSNFIKYIKKLFSGEPLEIKIGEDYKDGLIMSRYDEAVYIDKEELINNDTFI